MSMSSKRRIINKLKLNQNLIWLHKNITLVGASPLAKMLMDNMLTMIIKEEYNDFILNSNLESDEKSIIEFQCIISNNTRINYILHCKINETFESDIQNSISFIDDVDILLINFADVNNFVIVIEDYKNTKNNHNLGAGAIIGLIIAIVVVIALIIFLKYYSDKKIKICI